MNCRTSQSFGVGGSSKATPVPLSPGNGFAADFQVSCSTVPLSPGDGVAFIGVSDVLAALRFLVVAFFATVHVGFQATILTLLEFCW